MSPQSRQLWRRLGWTIVGIVICLCLLIVSLSQLQSDRTRRDISTLLTDKVSGRVQNEVGSYLSRIESLLRIVEKWGSENLAALNNPEQMIRGVRPVLDEYKNLAGLSLTTDGKNEISFLNSAEGWIVAKQRQFGGAWFKTALQHKGEIAWLQPDLLAPQDGSAISGAITWEAHDEQTTGGAIGYIRIKNFFDFVANLEPSPGGRVYLIDTEGRTLIRSGLSKNPEQLFSPSDDPVLQAAIAAGVNTVELNSAPKEIRVDGKAWWAGVRPLDPRNPVNRLVTLIPEEDIIGALPGQRYALPSIAGGLLLVGLIVIVWQLKRYRQHLDERTPWVTGAAELKANLGERIAAGESAHQEFKSTIRKNLRSGKIGKEIEKAWLKGVVAFLNSDGGMLFFGVDDNGEALGLDDDEFQSEDHISRHVKGLINQHIGAEFTAFTHFELLTYRGKTIGMLACQPSTEPAFLKIGQDEEFYVRNGPASLCLSVSQTLTYLKQRG